MIYAKVVPDSVYAPAMPTNATLPTAPQIEPATTEMCTNDCGGITFFGILFWIPLTILKLYIKYVIGIHMLLNYIPFPNIYGQVALGFGAGANYGIYDNISVFLSLISGTCYFIVAMSIRAKNQTAMKHESEISFQEAEDVEMGVVTTDHTVLADDDSHETETDACVEPEGIDAENSELEEVHLATILLDIVNLTKQFRPWLSISALFMFCYFMGSLVSFVLIAGILITGSFAGLLIQFIVYFFQFVAKIIN